MPPEPSGVSTLSILDFDLEGDLGSWEAASVVASGTTVYANVDRTYVATQRWIDPQTGSREAFRGHVTRIHRFDTPVDGEMTYVASGDVDGFLLNQFAMDEHEEHLRVASTSAPDWWAGRESSESQVTVLATEGNRLVEVGRVGGLGKTETIRAVRFMGPVGYVVTFRQTDPLYVIDLSDPTEPVAAGELKIPGFSAYLHPVAEGRLIGVGQDADPETGATKGLQISLFDVTDPTARPTGHVHALPAARRSRGPRRLTRRVGPPGFHEYRRSRLRALRGLVVARGRRARGGDVRVIAVSWDGDTLDGSRVLPVRRKARRRRMEPQPTAGRRQRRGRLRRRS